MSPEQLYVRLIEIFPDFANYWNLPNNCFIEEDGSFTLHGLFSEFSSFIRDRVLELPSEDLHKLGEFLEECLALPEPNRLSNAAATCFIEDLSHQDFTPRLAEHFGERAREELDNLNR